VVTSRPTPLDPCRWSVSPPQRVTPNAGSATVSGYHLPVKNLDTVSIFHPAIDRLAFSPGNTVYAPCCPTTKFRENQNTRRRKGFLSLSDWRWCMTPMISVVSSSHVHSQWTIGGIQGERVLYLYVLWPCSVWRVWSRYWAWVLS